MGAAGLTEVGRSLIHRQLDGRLENGAVGHGVLLHWDGVTIIPCENGEQTPVTFFQSGEFDLLIPAPLPAQPGLGVSPILFRRRRGDTQDLGRLGHRATEKVAELDQLSLAWRLLLPADPGLREPP